MFRYACFWQHGNRASTSASGSADLLLSLACPLSFPPSSLPAILTPTSPFAFLFAALYHPAFAALGPLRKELPNRTLFNVLGPLVNPARPGGIVLGVFKKELGPVFAEALRELGTERALVVCGREGLDEISPAGETDARVISFWCSCRLLTRLMAPPSPHTPVLVAGPGSDHDARPPSYSRFWSSLPSLVGRQRPVVDGKRHPAQRAPLARLLLLSFVPFAGRGTRWNPCGRGECRRHHRLHLAQYRGRSACLRPRLFPTGGRRAGARQYAGRRSRAGA